MIKNFFLIGTGSGIGGICRFLCQQFIQKQYPAFIPLGTLSVNIIGCLIIGILYSLSNRSHVLSSEMRLLLTTGFCGGYTTFSSFALENINMLQKGAFFSSALYISLSLVIGFAALCAGILLAKFI